MKKTLSNFHAIVWTIAYAVIVWAVMRFMFNFDITVAANWHRLMHAHLRGFPGFVLTIFLLAALPLYVATTTLIIRTKKALFTIPIPSIIKKAFTPTLIERPAPEPEEKPHDEKVIAVLKTKTETNPTPEKQIPLEMRESFRRAREVVHSKLTVKAPDVSQPVPHPDSTPDIPLPSDFDTTDTENLENNFDISGGFTFHDLDLNGSFDSNKTEESDENDSVRKYLESKNIKYDVIDDTIVTDKYVITSHTDSDFWVADADTWFAAGRSRPSPIASITKIATEKHLIPVLYLTSDNIMDFDNVRTDWEQIGIKIINDLDTLK